MWLAGGVAALALASLLGGCGFKLRAAPVFAFQTIALNPSPGAGVTLELRRSLGSKVWQPPAIPAPAAAASAPEPALPEVTLDMLSEQRERVVVGLNASGQVRELQLRIRVKFRLRNPQGKELIPETEILQQRDISFNESAVLAKEAEEGLLYRDMQKDIVQQLLRRLAAVKAL